MGHVDRRPGLGILAVLTGMVLGACSDDDSPTEPDPEAVVITSGVAITNISGAEDSERLYRIAVPAALEVTTTGGSGDVDLLVGDEEPSPTNAPECESLEFDNEESCYIFDPAAGNWYILLVGFSAYSGVTLTATVIP